MQRCGAWGALLRVLLQEVSGGVVAAQAKHAACAALPGAEVNRVRAKRTWK